MPFVHIDLFLPIIIHVKSLSMNTINLTVILTYIDIQTFDPFCMAKVDLH